MFEKALCNQHANKDYIVRDLKRPGLCENCEQVEECFQARHAPLMPMVVPQPAGNIG